MVISLKICLESHEITGEPHSSALSTAKSVFPTPVGPNIISTFFKNTSNKAVWMEMAKKKVGCKALGEAKYRSNLTVVRISARRATPQSAFYSSFPSVSS